MDAQTAQARRKVNTYGKGTKRIAVHDLFDVGTFPSVEGAKSSPGPLALLGRSGVNNSSARSGSEDLNLAARRVPSGRPSEPLRSVSPSTTMSVESSPSEATHRSMFDVHSSDEESPNFQSTQPLKKRKMTPIVSIPKTHVPSMTVGKQKSMNGGKSQRAVQSASRVGAEAEVKSIKQGSTRKASKGAQARMGESTESFKDGVDTPNRLEQQRGAPRSKAPPKPLRVIKKQSPALLSDTSDHNDSPKRKRGFLEDEAKDSPSPPALQMKSLRLASDINSLELDLSSSSSDEEMTAAQPVVQSSQTGRKRLVDKLDAPRSQSIDRQTIKPSLGRSSGESRYQHKIEVEIQRPPVTANALPPPRQRATYARQRSHLSDMIDSLDTHSGITSQNSSQQSFSQPASFGLASQMELEMEDSDEADAFTQIKSIHELRRGAAINKFDQDIESILDDLESHSKSLRITALLLLINKMRELNFLRHFQESGNFYRFTESSRDDADLITATLMVLVFNHVIETKQSPPKNQLQILSALYRLPPNLSLTRQSLSSLAKDRKENLNKLTVKDIMNFDQEQLKHSPKQQSLISLLYLGTINETLRALINSGEQIPDFPGPLLDAILVNFTREQKHLLEEDNRENRFEGIQTLLSLLEIASANCEMAPSKLATSSIIEVGRSISNVMQIARQARPEIEHSCLRLIVGLSNNEPSVCEALTEGKLIATVFRVIDDRFLQLAGLASREQAFDGSRLESVILAVGCLLNIAECADAARRKMLEADASGKSLVDKLVNIFNSHVDQTSEALTIDQTQVLVAFGYISALLCTLCLNVDARRQISESIRGEELSKLFEAAGIFLQHLRTVEEALGGAEGASSGFTARFTMVLDSLTQDNVER
ncbi:hypothetical protein PV08_11240 [Exophiala spinifera]|uniref:Wings apart-like protein C-terminal domain-containing protein n=1 Tax=Exophiala spinifera TaxID=91928 RepID=A0A0D2AU53_9EURO|nr:uncharacterized protein PV08_11240 [Exophiala spinifera]KIW10278.1 hypothetical protein PV08_11240 [Exophiala spinifera]